MIALDASLVIAHLSPHDRHHESATQYLRESAGEDLVMHPLSLAEVLVGGVRAGRGEEMLADLEGVGIRVTQRSEGESLRLATLRVQSGLRMPGCCALDAALTNDAPLATFDDALAEAARRCRIEVAP